MSDPWTPGPWRITSEGTNGSAVVVGPRWRMPAGTMAVTDARLIALAPEMAELLRLLVFALNTGGTKFDYDNLDDLGEKAETLLTLARDEA